MKRLLLFAFIAVVVVSFSSCAKVVDVPSQPVVSPLAGSWIISSAEESNGYDWQPISLAYEQGIFDFYDQGSVQYKDASIVLSGTWYTVSSVDSYYDEYGNYYSGAHRGLEMNITDFYSGNSLILSFDYIRFTSANSFVATYFDGKYTQRVNFNRY
jgi:hypothetical protein